MSFSVTNKETFYVLVKILTNYLVVFIY